MNRVAAPTVAIVGAGFAGIGMAIRLKRAGYVSFTLFERADDLGGVWRDNTYPGAACDVPAHLYSFSFEPNPHWSHRYATQPEILDYLRHCVHKYGIGEHIRFGTGVDAAEFDESRGRWSLTTDRGERLDFDAVVSGCGQLRLPAMPNLPGTESFAGPSFHTARWEHEHDLTGKRVALIGTGATAVQVAPSIVDTVRELRMFQRTPPYVIPRSDRAYSRWQRALFARLPALSKLVRAKLFGQLEARVLGFAHFPGLMRLPQARFRRGLRARVRDPRTRAALTPDYRMGCKRILVSDDFYPAVNRPNFRLVTDGIERVTPKGVRTSDGEVHEVDVIVYATGFRANDFLAPMRVTGRAGRSLQEAWRDGASAHLGITVSGFPNLFLLYGPNTNLGHNSIIYMIESQLDYVLDALAHLRTSGARYLDVRQRAQNASDERVQRRLRSSVFNTGCASWYIASNGRNTNNWPASVLRYRWWTRSLNPAEYERPG